MKLSPTNLSCSHEPVFPLFFPCHLPYLGVDRQYYIGKKTMQITIEEKGAALLIKLEGHMGHASVGELARLFDEWLAKARQNYVLDMSQLSYISSAGLRCLMEAGKKIAGMNGKLFLCAIQPEVKQVFDVSGFTSLFVICDNAQGALKKI
jgi:stage II sporulation protein AA (anti-sigma F factor antagonist)